MTRTLSEVKARAASANLNCDHDTVGDLDWCVREIERLIGELKGRYELEKRLAEVSANYRDHDEYLHNCHKILKQAGHPVAEGAIDGIWGLVNERDELRVSIAIAVEALEHLAACKDPIAREALDRIRTESGKGEVKRSTGRCW